MRFSFSVETITFNELALKIAIPDPQELKKNYQQSTISPEFLYWAKIWPAAKALSQFILQHQELVVDKKVVEIAAGLGLPSMIAASFAKEVTCTDAIPEAVEFMNISVELNSLTNVRTAVYNWNTEEIFDADILLMSDVNYEPEDFPQLLTFFQTQLKRGVTIILSTPQRLMAKPFIKAIAGFIFQQDEFEIADNNETVACSVFVLKIF